MESLRVMSFNLAGGYDEHEPENAWTGSGRSGLVCEVIDDTSPDLIGFQEVQWPNFATFGESLEAYDSFQGPHANDPPHLFNPVYWRRERLQPRARGGFWISDTPDSYSRSWGSACVRTATWVRFRDVATDVEFLHVNTHLDHISEQARTEGASLLNRWISSAARPGERQLLTADFNCNPWTPPRGGSRRGGRHHHRRGTSLPSRERLRRRVSERRTSRRSGVEYVSRL